MAREELFDESIIGELHELAGPDEPTLVEQLFRMFMLETPKRIERMRSAYGSGNWKIIRETGHQLKGTCKQLGLIGMVDLCQRLEECETTAERGWVENALTELELVFRETRELLEMKYTPNAP